jgi:sugar phosphate isomerase/epimerase
MKAGVSTYSLSQAIRAREMTVIGAIEWIAEHGGEHVEIVPAGFDMTEENIRSIVEKCRELELDISSYTIGANFIDKNDTELQTEINRVKKEVNIAAMLGTKLMRHDAASRLPAESTLINFEKDLPYIVKACREIADYALQFGITTSIENHGYHLQHYDRVQRVLQAVDRENFRTTVDIGNFVVVDLNPLAGVTQNAPFASMVHVKDFYLKDACCNPGQGFCRSAGGNYCRGAIVGHGNVNVQAALQILKDSGYDGYLSLEFEGVEDCRMGCEIGLENLKRYIAELVVYKNSSGKING